MTTLSKITKRRKNIQPNYTEMDIVLKLNRNEIESGNLLEPQKIILGD